jgi:hypothetical protein
MGTPTHRFTRATLNQEHKPGKLISVFFQASALVLPYTAPPPPATGNQNRGALLCVHCRPSSSCTSTRDPGAWYSETVHAFVGATNCSQIVEFYRETGCICQYTGGGSDVRSHVGCVVRWHQGAGFS